MRHALSYGTVLYDRTSIRQEELKECSCSEQWKSLTWSPLLPRHSYSHFYFALRQRYYGFLSGKTSFKVNRHLKTPKHLLVLKQGPCQIRGGIVKWNKERDSLGSMEWGQRALAQEGPCATLKLQDTWLPPERHKTVFFFFFLFASPSSQWSR